MNTQKLTFSSKYNEMKDWKLPIYFNWHENHSWFNLLVWLYNTWIPLKSGIALAAL